MTRSGFAALLMGMFVACAVAPAQPSVQVPTASSASTQAETVAAATLPGGTAINAQLNSSVDSKEGVATRALFLILLNQI